MGCELGKLVVVHRDGGEGNKRRRGEAEPPAPEPPDPRLPLTAKQKYSMMASWKGISRAMEPTGVYMFIKLFEQHQELLNLFEKFRELRTREEQANSMELAEHANTVMATLDEGIKGLDNLDSFFDFLTQVGASHHRIPGFKPEYFWGPTNKESASSLHEWLTTRLVAVISEQNVGETTSTDISGILLQPDNSGAEVWA